jgi:hypothetical protein
LISHEDKRDQCKSPFWVLEDLNCPGFAWKKAPASYVFYPKTNLAVNSMEYCGCLFDEGNIGRALSRDSMSIHGSSISKMVEFAQNASLF